MGIHVQAGFANPFLICDYCSGKVLYWHDPERCGCEEKQYNFPCEHPLGVSSTCTSWSPVDGCTCEKPCPR